MHEAQARTTLTRRDVLAFAGAGAAVLVGLQIAPRTANATAESVMEAIRERIGDKKTQEGRVSLKLPEIAENGNTVPLTVTVDSPMTEKDYVKSVHVFAEKNPLPNVATFMFTPASGVAVASTRMRLLKTQDIVAVAEMSDGSVYMARRTVKVGEEGRGDRDQDLDLAQDGIRPAQGQEGKQDPPDDHQQVRVQV
jgi:sulfur-oxidizing protein SoxY